jgi:hypothetical protein
LLTICFSNIPAFIYSNLCPDSSTDFFSYFSTVCCPNALTFNSSRTLSFDFPLYLSFTTTHFLSNHSATHSQTRLSNTASNPPPNDSSFISPNKCPYFSSHNFLQLLQRFFDPHRFLCVFVFLE